MPLMFVCDRVQAKRHDYSVEFRKHLKDVLLSKCGTGTRTVLAMEREVGTKMEPEADGVSIEESLRKEIEAMKKEALMRDVQLEAQRQQIAQLIREKEEITLHTADHMIAQLSELRGGEFNLNHLSAWPYPSRTPSVKSEGAKTAAYGLECEEDDIWSALSSVPEDPVKGSWNM